MRTLVLLAALSGAALAAQPIFTVPETGGWDRDWLTIGIRNDGKEDLKLEKGLLEGLTAADAEGKAIEFTAGADLAGAVIPAGETLIRRICPAKYFPKMGEAGTYSLKWAHPLFKDRAPLEGRTEVVTQYAVMELQDYGTLLIRFYADKAPKTVENFKKLTTQGFYNGLTFHRIIRGFMMQGGCPRGDGTGDPGYKFEDEASGIQHAAGVLSMANSGPNTNGSQFFICFDPTPWLDGKHTTFARVMEGMDVVRRVEKECKVPDQKSGRPLRAPKMTKVEWHEKEKK